MKIYIAKIMMMCGLGVLLATSNANATTFIDGLEDVPLMNGVSQIQKDTISFGNEESRFVEAYLTSSKIGFKSIENFYIKTLPQLGWTYQGKDANTLLFYRENEMLEIVKESSKPLEVRITVKNKL